MGLNISVFFSLRFKLSMEVSTFSNPKMSFISLSVDGETAGYFLSTYVETLSAEVTYPEGEFFI